MRHCALALSLAALAAAAGCDGSLLGRGQNLVRPTVAVLKFENRAGNGLGWNLSDGMKDILVDRLMATKRFHVIERPELNAILGEVRLQNSGVTREQDRAALGRIKNVQYLIKGTITDFGHSSTGTGFLSSPDIRLWGASARAVMSMALYVIEVESGEIVCSASLSESVRANDANVKVTYQNVGFGGSGFYTTPLGRATAQVIDKAVQRVSQTIASRRWQPRVASVQPDGMVVLNGGRDRGLKQGADLFVIAEGQPIIDPDTGDTLGRHPGKRVAKIRIYQVAERHSLATIIFGNASDVQVGMHCGGE